MNIDFAEKSWVSVRSFVVNVSQGLYNAVSHLRLADFEKWSQYKIMLFRQRRGFHGHERKLQVESTVVRGGARGLAEE